MEEAYLLKQTGESFIRRRINPKSATLQLWITIRKECSEGFKCLVKFYLLSWVTFMLH